MKQSSVEHLRLLNAVEDAIRGRSQVQHEMGGPKPRSKRSIALELEQVAGAMAVIDHLYPNPKQGRISELIPPRWIYGGPARGSSFLDLTRFPDSPPELEIPHATD